MYRYMPDSVFLAFEQAKKGFVLSAEEKKTLIDFGVTHCNACGELFGMHVSGCVNDVSDMICGRCCQIDCQCEMDDDDQLAACGHEAPTLGNSVW